MAAALQGEVTYLDLLDIQHPGGHFDFILCNHVLEHIPADKPPWGRCIAS